MNRQSCESDETIIGSWWDGHEIKMRRLMDNDEMIRDCDLTIIRLWSIWFCENDKTIMGKW